MKLIRKQVMISEWIDESIKKLVKKSVDDKQYTSYSEIVRMSLIMALAVPSTLMLKNIEDYEHKIRKEIESHAIQT